MYYLATPWRGGPIAQWESASFARRMPWVRIPVGPCPVPITDPSPYVGGGAVIEYDRTDAPSRVSVDGKGQCTPAVTGDADATVCTCSPGVHWIRSRVTTVAFWQHLQIRRTWLLCQLVDRSARELKTDVPSCDKPKGPARRERTWDLRIGILFAIALRNRERRELKHLSIGRKRKQTRCRY